MLRRTKYIWNQVPVFRLIWPFVGGIILALFFPFLTIALLGLAISVLTCIALLFFRPVRSNLSLIWMALVFIMGYAHTALMTERLASRHYSNLSTYGSPAIFKGRVISDPVEKSKSVKLELELEQIFIDDHLHRVDGKIVLYLQIDSLSKSIAYDDQLQYIGNLNEIQQPKNPSEFNYKRYMHFHQISHQAYVKSADWKLVEEGSGLIRNVQAAQHGVMDLLSNRGITERELAIVSALLVGYKHHLSSDQVKAFASAGAMHVLAVSGLHVGIVFLLLNFLLKPFEKVKWGRYIKAGILLLALWSYAALTGLSPSVTRACTMFSFVVVGQMIKRHSDIFNTLATSALFLLIINPFYLVEVGFQLSYLAVLGIVILQPKIYELWKPKNWILDKVWTITAVSIAAQLATFPLGLLYFHQFPNYFLLSNLVVIPAATIILPVGISLVAFNWVPQLSALLALILYYLVHGLDLFIQWVEGLPVALIESIDISILETYFIYMLVSTMALFLMTKRYNWLVWFLAMLGALEVFNIAEEWIQRRQKLFVLYSIKGHEAHDFIDGHHHVFVADTALKNDFEKMRFHVQHNWWKRDLKLPSEDCSSLHFEESLSFFNGNSFLFMKDSMLLKDPLSVDYLIIQEKTFQQPKIIMDKVDAGFIVLSQNLDWRTMKYWENELEVRGIQYWNMRNNGAFMVEY